ncbi:MAG TPA: hybrid sensor histidine kinase/response regulator [Cyanobacteria bacterium UBA8803]|nr:hybrid sensor histidine kinase/response regulator [Cyanobacteria bacterium UBA9273]HBL58570.1 hybrid sensor histidine kinase/response regulator [Cyanobacteria bacterium UBA8803]
MKKILVIEDEDSIRNNICEMLQAEGFETIEAGNGKQGLQLAQSQLPDLILCDITMPELDGYGVLNELRVHPATQTIPFIFLTAKATKVDLRQGMELGADDYLTKPFTTEALLTAIATRLEKQLALEKKSLQKLDELRSQISHALPHELYTPLNGILGLSAFMLDEYDTVERDEALQILKEIHVSGQRLYRLTKNFLLYAELELMATNPDRLQTLQSKEIDTYSQPLIYETAVQKAQRADRVADLQLDLQGTIVHISEANIQKIVEEIVDNAFKFSPPGTPVCVSDSVQDNWVILSVSDRGRGMTAEQIANLGAYMQFERKLYEQQGSGLGLAIAKRLAELHGGELRIESSPNQQTIVRVVLPGRK